MKIRYLIVMLLFLVSTVLAYRYDKKVRRIVDIDADGRIEIICYRGDIKISTYGGGKIRLTATIESNNKDELKRTGIRSASDRKTFKILPDMELRNSGISIEYILRVPKQLKSVQLTALNGEIDARGIYQAIDFKTLNGKIEFKGEFTGCRLSSANGDIEGDVKEPLKGDMSVQSSNGNIEIELDPDSGFRVEGFTITGSITNEFNIPIKKDRMGYRLKGVVNNGKHRIHIDTVNGSIKLLEH